MDIYTTAFTYPRRIRQISSSKSLDVHAGSGFGANGAAAPEAETLTSPSDAEAIQNMAMSIMTGTGCHVSYALADQGRGWNFLVSGAYQQVMLGRGTIMRDCPTKASVSIKVPRSEILDSPAGKPTIKADVRRRLDDIAGLTGAHIAVVNSTFSLSTRTPPDGISNSAGWSGLETERVCELVITGHGDAIDITRVRLLVMLDELSGLHAESCEIDKKLLPIIAGRKRHVLQTIQEETATNIYYPSPLQGLLGPEINPTAAPVLAGGISANTVWITGEFFGVQRARDMLYQISIAKAKGVISRDTAVLPRKLDWMVTDRPDELRAIMHDNGTFIQLAPLGSSTSLITIFGEHRVNIQRTIRSIMLLACSHYVASIWLLPVHFNVMLPPPTLNASQVALIIQQISSATGAEVVFKSNNFEMHGVEHEVRAAVAMVLELDIIKAFHHEIRFQLELANEHKEFISGKKNGKMNKIMQTTNVKIKFETFNDYNFLIDIAGNDVTALAGLALLQEELPAEVSFHVPESYHKRIIGVGGRSIQRIMKKFGVYVKFSNAEEFAALGGYADNEDNVVARTPAKNAVNLENLKLSVMELVNPKDKDYMNELVSIPRRYHRTLLGEKAIFIHDIEAKTNSRAYFPDKESASDVVTIFGPESQVQIASSLLLDHVPFEADMAVPVHPDLPHLCSSPDFAAFAERIKREYSIIISPNLKGPTAVSSTTANGSADFRGDSSFKFRCQRSNTDSLMTARELLEQFLLDHNVHVYPSPTAHTHKRGDSFTSSFPHFDSKLLSMRTRESADLGRPSQSLVDRRLRMASSSPDVKALFNGAPSYTYPKLEQPLEQPEEEEDGSELNYSGEPIEDHWVPGPLPPIGTGYAGHRSRHSEDAIKRGSDGLLDAKLHALTHARSMSDRARSLDLTASLSRITEASGTGFMPDSPTEADYQTGSAHDSPGMGAPALSFPSVYGPPPIAGTHGRAGSSGGGSTPASLRRATHTIDEEGVTSALQNLGL